MKKRKADREREVAELTEEAIKTKLENYCAYRERCELEVRHKLAGWQVPEDDQVQYIQYLKSEGFLNEDRFASAFARGKFRIKHWGRNRILAELRSKKLKESQVRQSVEQIDEGEYFLALTDLLEKRDRTLKEPDAWKREQKLFAYAFQKGYEPELIREALRAIKAGENL